MEPLKHSQYNSFIMDCGNQVWAGALTLAWTELRNQIVKEDIKLATENQSALQIINNFNKAAFKATDVSPQSIYVKSGFGQNTVDLINKEVTEKFPKRSLPKLDYHLKAMDIISYAYLFKQIDFPHKFERRTEKQFLFKGKKVTSFYAKNEDQKKQITVHNY